MGIAHNCAVRVNASMYQARGPHAVAAANHALDEPCGHDEESIQAREEAQRRLSVLRHLLKAGT